jgi:hypothetical protein
MPVPVGGSMLFLILMLVLILPVSALHIWDASNREALRAPSSFQAQPAPARLPALAGKSQASMTSPALPDIEAVKQKLSTKLKEMKAQGLPQEQLDKFAAEAKAKLVGLQNEKKKQDEKNKQMELQRLSNAKGAK